MTKITTVNHSIQKDIIDQLRHKETIRFRDLRPQKVDTNAFSYHVKALQKAGLIIKSEQGYSLGQQGLVYIERIEQEIPSSRDQPKIMMTFVIQNSEGDVLLQQREEQPFIGTWTFPSIPTYIDDHSVAEAAQHYVRATLSVKDVKPVPVGNCYIRVHTGTEVLSARFMHIFRCESDDIQEKETLRWARPHRLSEYALAPATEQIMARTFFRDPFFFEEFHVEW